MEYKIQKHFFSEANSSTEDYVKEFENLRPGANCLAFSFAGSARSECTINSILGTYENDCMRHGGLIVSMDPNIDREYLRRALEKLLAFLEECHPSEVEDAVKNEDTCGFLIALEENKKEIVCLVNDTQS